MERARATRRMICFGWDPDHGRTDAMVPSHHDIGGFNENLVTFWGTKLAGF